MTRRDRLPQVQLDRCSRESLHTQLARALRSAMECGELPPGSTLPSTRALASALGISRNTVVTAYDELTAEGRVAGRSGSATRVIAGASVPHMPDWRAVLRSSQYPVDPVHFVDADGNALYFHR